MTPFIFLLLIGYIENVVVNKKNNSGVEVITAAQLHSSKPKLRFCTGSNPVHGISVTMTM